MPLCIVCCLGGASRECRATLALSGHPVVSEGRDQDVTVFVCPTCARSVLGPTELRGEVEIFVPVKSIRPRSK
jgi:hypothetical protein